MKRLVKIALITFGTFSILSMEFLFFCTVVEKYLFGRNYFYTLKKYPAAMLAVVFLFGFAFVLFASAFTINDREDSFGHR